MTAREVLLTAADLLTSAVRLSRDRANTQDWMAGGIRSESAGSRKRDRLQRAIFVEVIAALRAAADGEGGR